jgi:hypothetical protein
MCESKCSVEAGEWLQEPRKQISDNGLNLFSLVQEQHEKMEEDNPSESTHISTEGTSEQKITQEQNICPI